MSSKPIPLLRAFRSLRDPRRPHHNTKRHLFIDIVIIAILAVICGADSWEDIEQFGLEKSTWLKTFLSLENGIPSHDTFARVFSIIKPDAFNALFTTWVESIGPHILQEIIAIDGKSVRRSYKKGDRPLHIVSAFASERGVVLGQKTVDTKTNEITVLPELLKTLDIAGCIITTDALSTQVWSTEKIKEAGADFVLAVKGNQQRLFSDIKHAFVDIERTGIEYAHTTETGHGRTELRECWTLHDTSVIRDSERWHHVKTLVCLKETRTIGQKTSVYSRYYISSVAKGAQIHLRSVRSHWSVENSLQWVLDIAFREDNSRARLGHAGSNLALVRKIALNLLTQEKTSRRSVAGKRLKAGWNEKYLLKIIGVTGKFHA
jgi:predicted transposase YbfD/YdcC